MLKFRCQHCGQRIAVGARHLGKLVTCPECGEPTHPLAEQIVSLQGNSPQAVKDRKPLAAGTLGSRPGSDECANCGHAFGRLQQRASWMGHSVCPACHGKLAGEIAAVEQAVGVQRPSARSDNVFAPPQRVAVHRVAEPTSTPVRLLARGAHAAGRMALAGMGTVSKERELPLAPADAEAPPALAIAGQPNSRLRIVAPSLQSRLFFVSVILSVTGVAIYGALTLLQALAGYLTAAAFLLLAIAGGYLLLRATLSAGRRYLSVRSAGRPVGASTMHKVA